MAKYLIILFSFSYAVITVSPDGTQDFTTIQEAIDYVTANPADLEIDVYPGTYQENLLIEADMIIRSVGDTSNTIIDGSLGNRSLGSTIVIRPESNTTHHPVVEIDGFSIKNGKGTEVVNKTITLPDGTHPTEKVGGGLFVYVNSPKVNNSQFLGNGDNSTDKGGAIFGVSSSDGIDFPDRPYQDHPDLEPATGTLNFSNNLFLGNDADYGHSLYILGNDYELTDLSEGYFDVYDCDNDEVPAYWVYSIETDVDVSEGDGDHCIESDQTDYYVSMFGNDDLNTGTETYPFLTIEKALSIMNPNEFDPATIHLSIGYFSPFFTGEPFAIAMISNVNLIGQGEELTILDAELTDRVLLMENCQNNIISNLTITGGNTANNGGGMKLVSSNPTLTNVTIENNMAKYGGGMYLNNSNPTLTHMTIAHNTASSYFGGGGMYLHSSNPTLLTNVTIENNTARYGGGMYLYDSNPTLTNVIIIGNTGTLYGGGMDLAASNPTLTNVTIENNTATEGGGMYLQDSDIDGENVFSDPTLTNVTISNNTASYDGGGMSLNFSNPTLINVTIENNTAKYGCGMSLNNSNPTLTHVTIANNKVPPSGGRGGGMDLHISNPTLTHVTIAHNTADRGGGTYLFDSNPTLTHVTIAHNMADWDGGGMYLNNSNPTLTNSIIWDNSPESIYIEYNGVYDSTPVIIFSDIEGGWYMIGVGNIDIDPLFTNSENGDYTFQEDSPCIDAGIAIEGMEYCGEAPDMGAYEYITEDCVECGADLADVTGDGQINILDLVQIANLILEVSTPLYECAADYNEDGEVNILDLVQIVNYILEN